MGLSETGWIAVSYVVAVVTALLFALYGFAYGYWHQRKQAKVADTEEFVTARSSQHWGRIAWSFYAGAVGAWAIATPAQYASFAGIVGVIVYAVASGLPILMIAFLGEKITKAMPHAFSLSDFMGWRYGPIAKTLVVLLCLFNLSIFLLAEYTTIGSIFQDFVGSVSWGIILVVGVLTLAYTAYGGLIVSLATDQVQGIASMVLTIMLAIFVAVTYRQPLPNPLPENLGPNEAGYLSIVTLSISLACSTVFSEAMWQRVWASADNRTLGLGAMVGCGLVIVLVFFSGFGGWLALAAGMATLDGDNPTNPNLYLIQVLTPGSYGGSSMVSSWVHIIVIMLAVIMNEGAVDSAQNGLTASVSGHFLKNRPLGYSRVAVLLLNIPLIVVGSLGYSVLSLFLIANLLTTCASVPVVMGLLPSLCGFITETGMVVGVVCGVLGLTGLGIGLNWVPGDVATSFKVGASWSWFDNMYDWRAFVAALCISTGATLLWSSGAWLVRRTWGIKGPGIAGLLMPIKGMKAITATPHWTPADVHLVVGHGTGAALPETTNEAEPAKYLNDR